MESLTSLSTDGFRLRLSQVDQMLDRTFECLIALSFSYC